LITSKEYLQSSSPLDFSLTSNELERDNGNNKRSKELLYGG
jgi:hypothetical protein